MANNPTTARPTTPVPDAGHRRVFDATGCTIRELEERHRHERRYGLAGLVGDAARELTALDRELAHAMTGLRDDLTRALTALGRCGRVNELGVTQARGTAIDALCARRADAARHLDQLLTYYTHTRPAPAPTPDADQA